ncbi:MAG: ArsR/SmtB family transcription factor [Butyrivibrio sp.]
MPDNGQNEFLAAHKDVVERVLEQQPAEEVLYDLAELFKVFGDSTRIRILYALVESELCVGDIAQLLNMGQSAVSHQLKILKDAKLVRYRREGKSVFYALDDEHVRNILNMGMEHVEE